MRKMHRAGAIGAGPWRISTISVWESDRGRERHNKIGRTGPATAQAKSQTKGSQHEWCKCASVKKENDGRCIWQEADG